MDYDENTLNSMPTVAGGAGRPAEPEALCRSHHAGRDVSTKRPLKDALWARPCQGGASRMPQVAILLALGFAALFAPLATRADIASPPDDYISFLSHFVGHRSRNMKGGGRQGQRRASRNSNPPDEDKSPSQPIEPPSQPSKFEVVFENGSLKGQRWRIPRGGTMSIGRQIKCVIRPTESSVDGCHAILREYGGVVWLKVLSFRETIVDGARLLFGEKTVLAEGSQVTLGGSLSFRLVLAANSAEIESDEALSDDDNAETDDARTVDETLNVNKIDFNEYESEWDWSNGRQGALADTPELRAEYDRYCIEWYDDLTCRWGEPPVVREGAPQEVLQAYDHYCVEWYDNLSPRREKMPAVREGASQEVLEAYDHYCVEWCENPQDCWSHSLEKEDETTCFPITRLAAPVVREGASPETLAAYDRFCIHWYENLRDFAKQTFLKRDAQGRFPPLAWRFREIRLVAPAVRKNASSEVLDSYDHYCIKWYESPRDFVKQVFAEDDEQTLSPRVMLDAPAGRKKAPQVIIDAYDHCINWYNPPRAFVQWDLVEKNAQTWGQISLRIRLDAPAVREGASQEVIDAYERFKGAMNKALERTKEKSRENDGNTIAPLSVRLISLAVSLAVVAVAVAGAIMVRKDRTVAGSSHSSCEASSMASKALVSAVRNDSPADVSVALAAGADPNFADAIDVTPLCTAVDVIFHSTNLQNTARFVPSADIVSLLLDAGADPNIKCGLVRTTPFLSLVRSSFLGGRKTPEELEKFAECIRLMLKHGADSNLEQGKLFPSPLSYAVECGADIAIVKILVEEGGGIVTDKMIEEAKGNPELLEYLKKMGGE